MPRKKITRKRSKKSKVMRLIRARKKAIEVFNCDTSPTNEGIIPDCGYHLIQASQEENESREQNPSAAAGSSKRPSDNVDNQGKKQRGRPTKKKKILRNEGSDRAVPEDSIQNPFEIIDIEEPIIKEEVLETDEFSEVKNENLLPNEGFTQENPHFEAVYCTPSNIKVESEYHVETSCSFNATETDTLVPDFMQKKIKEEPPEAEEEEIDEDDELGPQNLPPLLWRCPLVSCPEMFNAELEMYQHLNMNHSGKGLALPKKSKKVSGSRSECVARTSTINQLPIVPSPASGLVFSTTASPPHVTSVSSPVSTIQSVPSSSSGPITTTFTYSITTSSAPLVTTVVNSCTSSVMSTATISSVPDKSSTDSTSCLPTSLPIMISSTSSDLSSPPCLKISKFHSSNPLPQITDPEGLQKIMVAPIAGQVSGSTGLKKVLLLAPHQLQQNSPTKLPDQTTKPMTKSLMPQPLQIFQPSEHTIEKLPPCAIDNSDMFSISLAQFPVNTRVPIKRKLIDVVDCIKQKNVNPEKLYIAYYDNSSDSRTM